MPDAEEYRRYAAECLELAQRLTDADTRAQLLEMAEAWRELAQKVERGDAPRHPKPSG